MSYKKEIDDSREAPARKIIEEITKLGGKIRVYDPYVDIIETRVGSFKSDITLEAALKDMDCALFLVDHDRFRMLDASCLKSLLRHPVVIDGKNIFNSENMEGIIYLAIGKPDNGSQ